MKFHRIIILISILFFIFSGCDSGIEDDGTLQFSFTLSSRAAADTTPDHVRVWVKDPSGYLELGEGTLYAELALENGSAELTIDGLKPMEYSILVASGQKSGEGFVTNKYAYGKTNVIPGDVVEAEITGFMETDLTAALSVAGKDIISTIAVGNTLYAATNSTVYDISGGTKLSGLPSGTVINSISKGVNYLSGEDELWVNTTTGIIPWDSSNGFDASFSDGLTAANDGIPVDIVFSGSLMPLTPGSAPSAFYQIDSGMGGVEMLANKDDWDWILIDLSDYLKGQLINDFIITNELGDDLVYVYASSMLGGICIAEDAIVGTYSTNADDRIGQFIDAIRGVGVMEGDTFYPGILSMGYSGSGSDISLLIEQENHEVALFTTSMFAFNDEHPTYGVDVDTFTRNSTSRTILEEEIEGVVNTAIPYDTQIIAVSKTDPLIACMGSDLLVVINTEDVGLSKTYTLNEGLPGTVTDLTWIGNTLNISGTEGIVFVNF